MWKDHIVEDVRRVRKQQAAQFDYDIFAILADARQKQKTSSHKIVSFLCSKKKKQAPEIDKNLIIQLKKYNFPGNVRELRNMVERALILSDGKLLTPDDFSITIKSSEPKEEKKHSCIFCLEP